MLKTELLELIGNGENSGVEFKRDDVRPEQLAKEIVAMLNFQGGRVIIGVEDDGTITGLQRKSSEEWVMNTIRDKIHPQLLPHYEEVKIEGDTFVSVITFPQGISKPYVMRHNGEEKTFIRVGSTSQMATREQQMRLFEVGGMLHTEMLPVARTNSSCLDKARLENYLEDIVQDPEVPTNDEEWEKILSLKGFLVEPNGLCTVAGLLLFGKNPRRYLKQAGVRLLAFDSKDKEYKAKLDLIINAPMVGRWSVGELGNKPIDDGLTEKLLGEIEKVITYEPNEIDGSFRRETEWFYPLDVLREVIVNALAHRDWTRFVDIEISIYLDRVEVISPGRLQNSMTIEKMIAGQRYTRNATIMETLRDYGYVDFRGMGVRTKVIPLMKRINKTEPFFEATEDYLKTVLYKNPN